MSNEPTHGQFYSDIFQRWMEPGDCDSGPLADMLLVCSVCGDQYALIYMHWVNQVLYDQKLCHECNHWREIHDSLQTEPFSYLIIDGDSFKLAAEDAPKTFRGHAGQRFHIRRADGVEVHSTNLWCQGDVSEHWRDKIPDNAVFVPIEGSKGELLHGEGVK